MRNHVSEITSFLGFPLEPRRTVPLVFKPLQSHTSTSSKEQRETKMTNFLSLPLELRQSILFQAFKGAAFEDLRFSNFQSKLSWRAHDVFDLWQKYPRILMKICVPNIHQLAASLVMVHPQLETDMSYPLNLVLQNFENLKEVSPKRQCLELRFDSLYDPDTYSLMEDGLWGRKMTEVQRLGWLIRIHDARRKFRCSATD